MSKKLKKSGQKAQKPLQASDSTAPKYLESKIESRDPKNELTIKFRFIYLIILCKPYLFRF